MTRSWRHFLAFLGLLALRFASDYFRFPVDGFTELSRSVVVEYVCFYFLVYQGFVTLFQVNRWAADEASRAGLLAVTIYMFTHFGGYWWPAGGRAGTYADPGRFWLNFATIFVATGDARPWQIARALTCGTYCSIQLWRSKTPLKRVLLSYLGLYTALMLLMHPRLWVILPNADGAQRWALLDAGVTTYLIAAQSLWLWSMLVLLFSRPNRIGRIWVWMTVFTGVLFFAPHVLPEYAPAEWLLCTVCLAIVRAGVDLVPEKRDVCWPAAVFVLAIAVFILGSHVPCALGSVVWLGVVEYFGRGRAGARSAWSPWFSGVTTALILLGSLASTAADRQLEAEPKTLVPR